jgi:hypothetical protein
MVPLVATEKNPQRLLWGIDPETLRLVAQCLNHYATPGTDMILYCVVLYYIICYVVLRYWIVLYSVVCCIMI